MQFSPDGDRPIGEGRRDDEESRSAAHRDGDRILYSSEFRRLAGVTQVTSPQDDYVYHDRLTHSLKVAQVGVRLAQRLKASQSDVAGEIDSDVVYAASLAHDLGHPPFGHAAETELQDILAGKVARDGGRGDEKVILEDSFEGNAQSFRIVTRLSLRKLLINDDAPETPGGMGLSTPLGDSLSDDLQTQITQLGGSGGFMGLNLTWKTLFAIQKYPWVYGRGPSNEKLKKKWGFYRSERDYHDEMAKLYTNGRPLLGQRSINAQIMDWADDIAYAIHDSEDFYKAGLIPLERLRHDDAEWEKFINYAVKKARASLTDYLDVDAAAKQMVLDEADGVRDSVLEGIRLMLPRIHFDGSQFAHHQLHRFATKHIEQLSREVELVSPTELKISTRGRFTAEILKGLTSFYVHRTPALFAAQQGQRRVIRELFFDLWGIVREDEIVGSGSVASRLPNTGLPPRLWEFCQFAVTDPSMEVAGTRHQRLARAVVDFICSLTDKQATLLNERLRGNSVGVLSPYWLTA